MFYVMQHAFTQFQQLFVIRTTQNCMCGITCVSCARTREIHHGMRIVNTHMHMHVVVRYETFVRTRFMRCAS